MTGRLNRGAPKCFTTQQWDEWRAMARYVAPSKANSFCEDCLPDYQARMVAEHRCEHPQTVFRVDRHGMVSGVRWPSRVKGDAA